MACFVPSAGFKEKLYERPRAATPTVGRFLLEGHKVIVYGRGGYDGLALISYLYLGIIVVQLTREQSGKQLPISEFLFHGIKIFPSCQTRQRRVRICLQNQTQEQAQLQE